MSDELDQHDREIEERLESLPDVVKNAVYSANTEKLLQNVSKKHRLPYDKWAVLEDTVMMTLVGIDTEDDLRRALTEDVGLSEDAAQALLKDLADQLFIPIREELERTLAHPEAQEKQVTEIEAISNEITSAGDNSPGTEGGQEEAAQSADGSESDGEEGGETQKVERSEPSEHYQPGQLSYERKDVVHDPYRETP